MGLKITFMNIGRNDGILIECEGDAVFIDSGMRNYGLKAKKYIAEQGIEKLKYYIGSHAHKDHIGGAPVIIQAFTPDAVLVPHAKVEKQIKKFAQTKAEKAACANVPFCCMKPGSIFFIGGAVATVLAPIKIVKCLPGSIRENYNSFVIRIDYGEKRFLLTADAMKPEFDAVFKQDPEALKANVVKNPHHNGKQSASFIARTNPEVYVFSTAKGYLPSKSFVNSLKKRGIDVYITAPNRDGNVIVTSDGKTINITTEK